MFTIENDMDETLITILNDLGGEDVSVLIYDDLVYIRQWNEKIQFFDVITMTATMYYKLMKAWTLPEGTYTLEVKDAYKKRNDGDVTNITVSSDIYKTKRRGT